VRGRGISIKITSRLLERLFPSDRGMQGESFSVYWSLHTTCAFTGMALKSVGKYLGRMISHGISLTNRQYCLARIW
jgi:hypothetical protein